VAALSLLEAPPSRRLLVIQKSITVPFPTMGGTILTNAMHNWGCEAAECSCNAAIHLLIKVTAHPLNVDTTMLRHSRIRDFLNHLRYPLTRSRFLGPILPGASLRLSLALNFKYHIRVYPLVTAIFPL
jgi:hypothetical protein